MTIKVLQGLWCHVLSESIIIIMLLISRSMDLCKKTIISSSCLLKLSRLYFSYLQFPPIFSCFSNHQGAVLFFFLLLSLPSSVLQWYHEWGNIFSEYDSSNWLFYVGYYLCVLFSPIRSRTCSLLSLTILPPQLGFGFRIVPVGLHPGLVTSDYGIHEVGVTVCGVQHVLSVLGVRIRPGTRHFPCNENPTRPLNTTSPKCCLPSTDAIDRREKNYA